MQMNIYLCQYHQQKILSIILDDTSLIKLQMMEKLTNFQIFIDKNEIDLLVIKFPNVVDNYRWSKKICR